MTTALSPRERDVVRELCTGCANKEIAYRLGLTEGTVKQYLDRIAGKTGVRGRLAIAMWERDRRAARDMYDVTRATSE